MLSHPYLLQGKAVQLIPQNLIYTVVYYPGDTTYSSSGSISIDHPSSKSDKVLLSWIDSTGEEQLIFISPSRLKPVDDSPAVVYFLRDRGIDNYGLLL